MLKDLVKIANKLDQLGFQREADIIDSFIRKTLDDSGVNYTYNWSVNWSGEPEKKSVKTAMHFGEENLRCDQCGRIYHQMAAGSKSKRGQDLCKLCSGDISPEELSKREHGAREHSFRRRYMDLE